MVMDMIMMVRIHHHSHHHDHLFVIVERTLPVALLLGRDFLKSLLDPKCIPDGGTLSFGRKWPPTLQFQTMGTQAEWLVLQVVTECSCIARLGLHHVALPRRVVACTY